MIETFVFDTNALISAYILDESVSRKAYNKAFDSGILIYSAATFDEFAEKFVLSKFEKYIPLERRLSVIKEFQAKAVLVEVELQTASIPGTTSFLN